LFLDVFEIFLQLDELRFAEGSPIRGTKEDQYRSLRSGDGLEVLDPTVLIDSFEVGCLRTHLGTSFDLLLSREAHGACKYSASERQREQTHKTVVYGNDEYHAFIPLQCQQSKLIRRWC